MATAPQNPSEQKKKNWFARHKILTGILGVFLFIILISSLGSDDTSDSNTQTQNTTNNVPAVKTITIPSLVEYDDDITSEDIAQDIDLEDVTIPSNYTVISAGNTNITNPVGSEALVSETIDGDTVRLSDGNKVRILGIDTPETKDPRKPVQCFGKEASAKMKELVEGKKVILLVDASQGDKDKYGRLLRYVYSGNTDIGAQMVKEGYAYAYTKYPVAKMEEYKALENEAKENNRGLWADNTCDGSTEFPTASSPTTTQPTSTNTSTTPTQTNTSTPTTTTPTTNTSTTPTQPTTTYSCDCSKACGAMSSCEEAYYQLDTCGCSKRDNDGDGVPCETICSGG